MITNEEFWNTTQKSVRHKPTEVMQDRMWFFGGGFLVTRKTIRIEERPLVRALSTPELQVTWIRASSRSIWTSMPKHNRHTLLTNQQLSAGPVLPVLPTSEGWGVSSSPVFQPPNKGWDALFVRKKYLHCTSHWFFPSSTTSLLVLPYLYTSVNTNTDWVFISLRFSWIEPTADGNRFYILLSIPMQHMQNSISVFKGGCIIKHKKFYNYYYTEEFFVLSVSI